MRKSVRAISFALAAVASFAIGASAQAQNSKGANASVTIRADQPGARINRAMYGQFAEHLGRGIYEGIWVG